MIKITKPGQTVFHGFCDRCGCEFTYELTDLKLSAAGNKVSCPTCGKDYYHPSMVQNPAIPGGIDYQWPSDSADPCAGCIWRSNLEQGGIYVGDIPCTWCNKNKFNNITSIASPLTETIKGINKLQTHLTPCVECLDDTKCTSSVYDAGSTDTIHTCCDEYTKPEIDKIFQKVYDAAGVKADDIAQGTVMSTILNACQDCTSTLNKCGDTEGSSSCPGEHKCSGKKNCKGKH